MHWFFKVLILIGILGFFIGFTAFIRPKLLPVREIKNAEKYGIILQSEDWGGVIRVTGDILSVPGAQINVEPGAKILVANKGDKFNMDFLPVHLRSGVNDEPQEIYGVSHGEPFLDEGQKISIRIFKFYARGSKLQPILITPDTENKSPYDINTIWINSGILSNIKLSNFRRFEIGPDVIVTNSSISDIGECGICTERGKPQILDNEFNRTLRDYIWVKKASPLISGNTFLPTKGNGIVVDPRRFGSPKILNNEFQLPGFSSVYFLTGDEKNGGLIENNLFAAGDITIPCDSRVKIYNNHIKSNLKFLKSGNCVGEFKIGVNYWEMERAEKIISERIINKEPQFQIKLEDLLKDPPVVVQ